MKIIFLLLLSTSLSFSYDPSCDQDDPLKKVANQFAVPNCLKPEFRTQKEKENQDLCQNCGHDFIKKYTGDVKSLNKNELQEKFIEVAVNDYKKSITNNLIEAVKLAALPNSNLNLSASTKACAMKTERDFTEGCKSPAAIRLLQKNGVLGELQKEVSNELARIVSREKGFSPQPTLLARNSNLCHIPENHILFSINFTLEEAFSSETIKALSSIDPKKYRTIDELLISDEFAENYDYDSSELIESIRLHPYLREKFKDPETAINFFKSIKSPYASANLREKLYDTSFSKTFDQNLAKNCNNSYAALQKAICSHEFETGNINLQPGNNLLKLSGEAFEESQEMFASNEKLLEKNLKVVKYCSRETKNTSLKLSKISENIAEGLDARFLSLPLTGYQSAKHQLEIGNIQNKLCQLNSNDCTEVSLFCKIAQKFKRIDDKSSLESKLANSTNPEVKNLLRSMIGDTTSADPKTKEILIAHGIIPQEDGKFIEQPDIPERQPDYFAKAASHPTSTELAQAPKVSPVTASSQQASARRPSSEMYNDGYSNIGSQDDTSTTNYSMPDFSEITRDSEELRNIQDEIRRRLTELPVKNAPTKAEAKKILRDSFKARGRTLPAVQEERLAEQMVSVPTSTSPASQQPQQNFASKTEANRAAVSNTDTQLEKWKKNQANAALMGMAGARAVSGSTSDKSPSGNAATEKELSKVALNLPEDPSVRLSDIFANKYHANDPETQLLKVLLKNRNNFVLQIKSANFRVIFDEKQNFNLLLESGDKKEAERIRPQLEIFLKRLKT